LKKKGTVCWEGGLQAWSGSFEKAEREDGKRSKRVFPIIPVLGMFLCAAWNEPPRAFRNKYKYLMAMIERLFFSSG
jgi:hypothetical protein